VPGIGYGLFLLDDASRAYLLEHIEGIPDALTRGSAWVTLWDNLLEGRVRPGALIDAALRALPRESDEQNAQRVLAYVVRTFWKFLTEEERTARSAAIEAALRQGLDRATTQSLKAAWFNAYPRYGVVAGWTGVARARLAAAMKRSRTWSLPSPTKSRWRWSWRCARCRTGRLFSTRSSRAPRIPDRKARFAFVMPALSADPVGARAGLRAFSERGEPAARALGARVDRVSQPPAASGAREALRSSRTRPADRDQSARADIFFPTRWMESTLGGHRSPEVAADGAALPGDEPSVS
jgi:aminopeptidase N